MSASRWSNATLTMVSAWRALSSTVVVLHRRMSTPWWRRSRRSAALSLRIGRPRVSRAYSLSLGDLETGAQGLEQGPKDKNVSKIMDLLSELLDVCENALSDKTTCKMDEAFFKTTHARTSSTISLEMERMCSVSLRNLALLIPLVTRWMPTSTSAREFEGDRIRR